MVQAIAIDEAQFFPDLLEFCLEAAENDNKLVVIAGLDGDFRRKKFGQVCKKSFLPGFVSSSPMRIEPCKSDDFFASCVCKEMQSCWIRCRFMI